MTPDRSELDKQTRAWVRRFRDDPAIEAIAATAPPSPPDALDLLRRTGFPFAADQQDGAA